MRCAGRPRTRWHIFGYVQVLSHAHAHGTKGAGVAFRREREWKERERSGFLCRGERTPPFFFFLVLSCTLRVRKEGPTCAGGVCMGRHAGGGLFYSAAHRAPFFFLRSWQLLAAPARARRPSLLSPSLSLAHTHQHTHVHTHTNTHTYTVETRACRGRGGEKARAQSGPGGFNPLGLRARATNARTRIVATRVALPCVLQGSRCARSPGAKCVCAARRRGARISFIERTLPWHVPVVAFPVAPALTLSRQRPHDPHRPTFSEARTHTTKQKMKKNGCFLT